jgi:hypothetical protein
MMIDAAEVDDDDDNDNDDQRLDGLDDLTNSLPPTNTALTRSHCRQI